MPTLLDYAWTPHFASLLPEDESPDLVARVVQEHKEAYLVRAAAIGMKNPGPKSPAKSATTPHRAIQTTAYKMPRSRPIFPILRSSASTENL